MRGICIKIVLREGVFHGNGKTGETTAVRERTSKRTRKRKER